ncbi:hypothetical protein L1887_05197 [Cichorium endivia]|nr:hypothetical protein L1887_05197 [Cichorium endivia]
MESAASRDVVVPHSHAVKVGRYLPPTWVALSDPKSSDRSTLEIWGVQQRQRLRRQGGSFQKTRSMWPSAMPTAHRSNYARPIVIFVLIPQSLIT